MQYIQACLLTKQNFFWCFDAGLEHMAARSRGNGTDFDWLRKSCDLTTCDLSPDGKAGKVQKAYEISYLIQVFISYLSYKLYCCTLPDKQCLSHGMFFYQVMMTLLFLNDVANTKI